MWATIDDASNNAIAYLAYILPCLAPCGLTLIVIQIKKNWSADKHTWQTLDDAIVALAQSTFFHVVIRIDPYADIPSWEMLPYSCEDDLSKEMLPRCAAGGLTEQYCHGGRSKACKLHSSRR